MDQVSQDLFDKLVQRNPEDLTPEEAGFLFARRDYLNHNQEETFADVLKIQAEIAEAAATPVGEEPDPNKKSKKSK